MMKLLLMYLFMILLLFDWWIFLASFIFYSLMILFVNYNYFYCSLSYSYGVDLISYWMIFLTLWIVFLMIMSSYKIKINYMSCCEFLFVSWLMFIFLFLCFSCMNLFMFYVWFESSMIPILFLIFGWGYQPERLSAGMYLIFYTLFGSFPLLICIFYISSINLTTFYFLIDLNFNIYMYLSLILAFLFKMPMFFVHFWLPKAHVEAPVSGSMILAGVLLKLGGYGLYRVYTFMYIYLKYNFIWIGVSMMGSFVIGLLCLCQVDMKSMIAYSSVSHMGLVIGGIMTCNTYGFWGSFIMMLGHGLCSSGLFSLANMMYERTHSRSILINKGFLSFMPSMSLFWFLLVANNMSSPPSLNLVGEVMLIMSLMSWSNMTILFLGLSSFLSCAYSIYLYSITQHGVLYSGMKFEFYSNIREYYILILHWVPLNLLFMKFDMLIL
uniref:NADH-ubiquinone oxidoreductase chain 4 n=1 Tax=Tropidothorax cruciger TaxID=1310363 RepID=A0A7T1TVG8_9HEMI|nr:NADH dehydrogenase subunit 4 [Tropidothorax cruciger]QPP20740.1 NADH dehydrogenase subunit 4 [Tropidothorax cruciger]